MRQIERAGPKGSCHDEWVIAGAGYCEIWCSIVDLARGHYGEAVWCAAIGVACLLVRRLGKRHVE